MGVTNGADATDSDQASRESPRVALFSRRSAEMRVWHACQYEFEDIIAEVDDARFVLPEARGLGPIGQLAHGAANRGRRVLGRPRRAAVRRSSTAFDSELFFGVFAAPHEIGVLPSLHQTLSRAAKKVAFIVEMYVPDIPASRDYLRQLRGFDHIFVFTRDVIPAISEITGVETSFLTTGVDALSFTPSLTHPTRHIDVMSYGRRIPTTHRALVEASARNELYYFYDTVRGPFDLHDHREHRQALAAALQRSRYCVIHRNNDDARRSLRTGGEETLSNRLFEATATGTTILGSVPDTPDFARSFGWVDSVIPIPQPWSEAAEFVRELDRDPERINVARGHALRAGLRRLDWVYRWQEVLSAVGLDPRPSLLQRTSALEQRALALEGNSTDDRDEEALV